MKKRISWMLSLIVMAVSMQAQTLSGKLVDEKNEPLAYANVVLQQVDSTFVNGKTSDEKGDFRIEAPRPGSSTGGDLLIRTATITMPPTKKSATCSP